MSVEYLQGNFQFRWTSAKQSQIDKPSLKDRLGIRTWKGQLIEVLHLKKRYLLPKKNQFTMCWLLRLVRRFKPSNLLPLPSAGG